MINLGDFLQTKGGEVGTSQAFEEALSKAMQEREGKELDGPSVIFVPAGQYLVEKTIEVVSGDVATFLGERLEQD